MIIVRQMLLAEIDDNKVAVSQNKIKTVSRLPVESFLKLLEIIKQLVDHLFVGDWAFDQDVRGWWYHRCPF